MKTKARNLRKTATDAERLLWRHLRNRQLGGYKFRRQHNIGRYIVDFVCMERHLVVEIDGGQHALQRQQDESRTRYLESEGFEVIRFWNNEVLQETEAVLMVILGALEGTGKKAPSPRPSPPQDAGGEGGK